MNKCYTSKDIKFRVWHTIEFEEGKMYYSDDDIFLKKQYVKSLSTFIQIHCEDRFITGPARYETLLNTNVMQFIGLSDKSGKDIYEGDIVKFDANYCVPEQIGWRRGIVKWDHDELGYYFDTDAGYMNPTNCRPETLEVIGNIYEDN